LEDRRAWIVGSVALAALSFSCDLVVPNNLNVITSALTEDAWITFFRDYLGYKLRSVPCGSFYVKLARSRLIFTHDDIEVRCLPFAQTSAQPCVPAQNNHDHGLPRSGNIRAVPPCSQYADGECDFCAGVDLYLRGFDIQFTRTVQIHPRFHTTVGRLLLRAHVSFPS
jgi:hypothetical protein